MAAPEGAAAGGVASERLRLCLGGAVQGVGFRPFAYRLARELELSGFVENSLQLFAARFFEKLFTELTVFQFDGSPSVRFR